MIAVPPQHAAAVLVLDLGELGVVRLKNCQPGMQSMTTRPSSSQASMNAGACG